ncbi:AAA family ATPase [Microbacterium sp.]|uniref:AAA family ATPase n=1 Tax=Microbacterium sp. TaxID=51671 RepID=UPI0039E5C4B0
MKLHRLDLTGFGPFRETQTVDFDAFDGHGVFLISGRTGAGKSSILDGVSFALYGSVPRYEGGERRLRSDHSFLGDPTEVVLEFTQGERRLRVTRAPEYERPAKRGGGMTVEPQRAVLEEWTGDGWLGLAAKPREVAQFLDEILGLNAQQFQQVILLAQNKFSRFLLATAAERQSLLRTLFGTRRFERYEEELETRRKALQRELETAGERVRTLLGLAERLVGQRDLGGNASEDIPATDLARRRDAVAAAGERARYRVETAERARDEAEAAATTAERVLSVALAHAERLAALDVARREWAQLDAARPAIDAARTRLRRAREAEALRAPLDAVARAEEAFRVAAEEERSAYEAWNQDAGDADPAVALETLTGDIARWTEALADEEQAAVASATIESLALDIEAETERLATFDTQQAQIPAERERLERARDAARTDAAQLPAAEARQVELRERLAAAREAASLAGELENAERAYLAASEAASQAAAEVTALLQRRVADRAGELAAALVDGEPCAVCGSTSHPSPASAPQHPAIDDDAVARAEERRDAAREAEHAAASIARDVRERHAAAAARSGGRDVAALTEEEAVAGEQVRARREAAAEVERLDARRAELDELAAAAAIERDRVATALAEHRERLTGLRATLDGLQSRIAEARGDSASVAERLAEAANRRDRARACVRAAERRAEAERSLASATADLAERLDASEFADAAEAAAALRDDADRARLDEEIRSHTDAEAGVRARLLDLELRTVDVDAAEVEPARAARDATGHARAAAIAAERDARSDAERLGELLSGIDAAREGLRELEDQAAVVTRLADTVAGRAPNTKKMDLETFVLAAELEEIVAAANLHLDDMSAGRYTLHHSDAKASHGRASGLGIDVLDAHTGKLRSPQSLSGGETFLASLALALGLAEVVTSRAGGIRLDTLFVDEGFGSLDPETLDLAMRTLDALRAGGRTVGVISHVEAMKEQLAARLVVESTSEGPSVIRQDGL